MKEKDIRDVVPKTLQEKNFTFCQQQNIRVFLLIYQLPTVYVSFVILVTLPSNIVKVLSILFS